MDQICKLEYLVATKWFLDKLRLQQDKQLLVVTVQPGKCVDYVGDILWRQLVNTAVEVTAEDLHHLRLSDLALSKCVHDETDVVNPVEVFRLCPNHTSAESVEKIGVALVQPRI
jgi:hypothetical protein